MRSIKVRPEQLDGLPDDFRAEHPADEDGLVTPGLASVGLPVLDHTGHPLAAVSVTYVGAGVDATAESRLVDAVRRATEALSRRLGG